LIRSHNQNPIFALGTTIFNQISPNLKKLQVF
jgi:hypothetical protein